MPERALKKEYTACKSGSKNNSNGIKIRVKSESCKNLRGKKLIETFVDGIQCFLFFIKIHSFYIYALLVWDLFIPQSRKKYIYIKKPNKMG